MKADGCDINQGLKETTKLQWRGDVDLNDGAVQRQYESYRVRLQKADKLSASGESAVEDLRAVLSALKEDLEFIQTGTYIYCNVKSVHHKVFL